MPERHCPHPRCPHWRRIGLEISADHDAISHYVDVPVARDAAYDARLSINACRTPLSAICLCPIFLLFALHRRCIGVLHLEPVRRAAGAVGRIFPLRHDTFSPSLHECRNTVSPSPSMCSLNRMPTPALAKIISSVALRPSSGSRAGRRRLARSDRRRTGKCFHHGGGSERD
jgi:hypothetical protein